GTGDEVPVIARNHYAAVALNIHPLIAVGIGQNTDLPVGLVPAVQIRLFVNLSGPDIAVVPADGHLPVVLAEQPGGAVGESPIPGGGSRFANASLGETLVHLEH